jgi:hypothetical protein
MEESAASKTVQTLLFSFLVAASSFQLVETGSPLFFLIIGGGLWGLYELNGDLLQ